MTPLQLAQSLAKSGNSADRVLGVAIVTRGLSDDTHERQGWPLDMDTVDAAASHLGVSLTPEERRQVLDQAPQLGDGILNEVGEA